MTAAGRIANYLTHNGCHNHEAYTLETLAQLEETALSIWMRESGPAFFGALTLHSLAMAFVVGISLAVALRLVGVAPRLAIGTLIRFYTLHWYCAVLVFLSGAALLLAYPAKALTNPVFYIKLGAICIALLLSRHFQNRFSGAERPIDRTSVKLAYLCLALWVLSVSAGRFLAYTHSVLLASRFY